MSKHTPMAQVAENFVFILRGPDSGERWPVGKQLYAESQLILAAPELLESLQEIVRNDPFNQSSAGIIARAAIAKATGGKA